MIALDPDAVEPVEPDKIPLKALLIQICQDGRVCSQRMHKEVHPWRRSSEPPKELLLHFSALE
jgi:hypothetical protein